jgi:lipopolysaccharide biosynthesis glycosyltransferase
MNISFSCSEKYYDLLITAIYSIQSKNSGIHFFIFFNSNNMDYFDSIRNMINNENNQVQFFDIDLVRSALNHRFIKLDYHGLEAYFRLLIPELLALDRVLHLDVDIITLDKIDDLYNTNLGEYSFAARPYSSDFDWVKQRKNTLFIPSEHDYFNSGIILMDLKKLKLNGIFRDAISFIGDDLNKNDQDALNIVSNNEYYKLNPRYNWTLHEINLCNNPVIVHFTGKYKPNIKGFIHPYANVFRAEFIKAAPDRRLKLSIRYYIISRLKAFLKSSA